MRLTFTQREIDLRGLRGRLGRSAGTSPASWIATSAPNLARTAEGESSAAPCFSLPTSGRA